MEPAETLAIGAGGLVYGGDFSRGTMVSTLKRREYSGVGRIVVIYAVFSGLWIFLSDTVLEVLAPDVATMASLSIAKGIAFIALTSLLLYRLILRYVQEKGKAEERIVELNHALEKHNAELDAERAHWRAAIRGMADEVGTGEARGMRSLANPTAAIEAGLGEVIDKSIEQLSHEAEFLNADGTKRPPDQAPLARSLRGETVRGEETMRNPVTGGRRYRQFSSAPIRDAAGAVTGAIAIVRDITDHKEAELALGRLLTRMRLLFDASVEITALPTSGQLLTSVARAARELAGASYAVAVHDFQDGKFSACSASHSEGSRPCLKDQVCDLELGRVFMELLQENESLRLSGAEMRVHPLWRKLTVDQMPMRGLLGSRLKDVKGKPNGMILVSEREDGGDFSSEDEAALNQLAIISSLALQHIDSEESLITAMEEADSANRVKSQFLANMGHELRTPMAGILGMLQIALGGPLQSEQREFVQTAHDSASSLVRILNDILELTRIKAGKLTLEQKPFQLRECVANVVDIFHAEARRKGLGLHLFMQDDIPDSVIGDRLQLSQVLTNLVANGVKFTERGKVELRVEVTGTVPSEKIEVTFTITDTGIGIPREKKSLIFHPFSQADESHSRRYGGAGLGLPICKGIVERMGGTIAFDCQEGGGCSFTFTVPLNT